MLLVGVVLHLASFLAARSEGGIAAAGLGSDEWKGGQLFSLLAGVMEDFFQSGQAPWPLERSVLIAGLLEIFGRASTHLAGQVETPELAIAYEPIHT